MFTIFLSISTFERLPYHFSSLRNPTIFKYAVNIKYHIFRCTYERLQLFTQKNFRFHCTIIDSVIIADFVATFKSAVYIK